MMKDVVFGKWKNRDKTYVISKVYSDDLLKGIKDDALRDRFIKELTVDWIIAASIFRGAGSKLKGESIEKTYGNIQELDISETKELGEAFSEWHSRELGDLKKK